MDDRVDSAKFESVVHDLLVADSEELDVLVRIQTELF